MRDPDEEAVLQIYCETCGALKPLVESGPMGLEESRVHYYELSCRACSRVIAVVQIAASSSDFRNAPAQRPC